MVVRISRALPSGVILPRRWRLELIQGKALLNQTSPTRFTTPAQTGSRAALSLVPPLQQKPKYSPPALWHLLSLDAPTVAALWTWFVARCCGVALPWRAPATMFLAVWMLYAADRLLDARLLDTEPATALPELEERHRFHHRHKKAFLAGIAGASILLTALLPRINFAALRLYALLASLLFAYFFLIHIYPSNNSSASAHRLPKELAVGIFFPAAVFIPTVARAPGLRLTLAPAALLFAAVCTLNCLYLYAWEHPGSRESAHWTTRFATRHLRALSGITALLCAVVFAFEARGVALLVVASGVSALLLLLLHLLRDRFAAIHLRAAADMALLTPLLLVFFLR